MISSTRKPRAFMLLAAASVSILFAPWLATLLEDRPSRLWDGAYQFWRPWSGHLTHRSWTHCALNLAFFLPLAWLCERRRGSVTFLGQYVFLAATVHIGVRLLHPGWESYRGLSGVVYGLLVFCLVDHAVAARRSSPLGSPPRGATAPVFATVVLTGVLVKTALEVIHGGWLLPAGNFRESLRVVYLPGSHLGGVVGGLCLALISLRPAARRDLALSSRRAGAGSRRPDPGRPVWLR